MQSTCCDADCLLRACALGSGRQGNFCFALGLPREPRGTVAALSRLGRLHRVTLHAAHCSLRKLRIPSLGHPEGYLQGDWEIGKQGMAAEAQVSIGCERVMR